MKNRARVSREHGLSRCLPIDKDSTGRRDEKSYSRDDETDL